MRKKLVILLLASLAGGLVFVIIALTSAHLAIRRERVLLPSADAVAASAAGAQMPERVSVINTASQAMPRSAVLEAKQDPQPQQPYVMSHPAFVLEWADGRMLLIDSGMNREQAVAFGKPLALLAGADPLQPLTSVAERLGSARRRLQGVIFTHLHTDHTGGILDLCRDGGPPLTAFMTEAQAERPNYTTRPGLDLLRRAGCVQEQRLSGTGLLDVPGFPGVSVVAAGGHTPGSQLVVAHVHGAAGTRSYVFAGDIANNIDGITYDIPKPLLYRWLIVPEDNQRQATLRHFLRALHEDQGLTVVVSHDLRNIEQSGIPAWEPRS